MRRPTTGSAAAAPISLVLAATALAIALLAGCGGPPGRDGASFDTTETDLTACPGAHTLQGVDVSIYQGGSIDWGAVAGSGREFAIARVSDGFYLDPDFARNWAGIKKAGMIRGVYQFFRPRHDAVAQADLLLQHVGHLGAGDLPPVLDIEATDGASPAQLLAGIKAWVEHIEAKTGKRPILYVGSYFWNDNVKGGSEWSKYPLWLPAYGPTCPLLPSPWRSWVMHQYGSTGRVSGIPGNVDVSLFNGTLADLKRLAGDVGCTPHCDGSVIVSADCGRGDCAAYGARCVNDAQGVRCVFGACPNTGEADICLSSTKVAHCKNGALSAPGDCGAYGAFCSTAGRTAYQARCVSSLCVASHSEVPKAHEACGPHGTEVLHCDANGAPNPENCPAGQQCSAIGGPHCDDKVCPASGVSDVCIDERSVGHCSDGSLAGAFDCTAVDLQCAVAGGSARCVSPACMGNATAPPPAHDVCLDDATIGHCDSGAGITSEACGGDSSCVAAGGAAHCVSATCLGSATTPPAAHDTCVDEATLGHCDSNGGLVSEGCPPGSSCTEANGGASCVPDPSGGPPADSDGGPGPNPGPVADAGAGVGGADGGADASTSPADGSADGGPAGAAVSAAGCRQVGGAGWLLLAGLFAARPRPGLTRLRTGRAPARRRRPPASGR